MKDILYLHLKIIMKFWAVANGIPTVNSLLYYVGEYDIHCEPNPKSLNF